MENDLRESRTTNPAQEELRIIAERRKAAGLNTTSSEQFTFGLALSGGGIRSATFCLGAIRALAKNQTLKWFDYLSTVSGGGYVGAALGRLYSENQTPKQVEAGLASDDSLLLWWLRSNGRYLTPSGRRDLRLAYASMLRGFIATQLEVGMLGTLFACLVLFPRAALNFIQPIQQFLPSILTLSIWWSFIPVLLFIAGIFISAYWFCHDDGRKRTQSVYVSWAFIAFILGVGFFSGGFQLAKASINAVPLAAFSSIAFGLVLFSLLLGLALYLLHAHLTPPEMRLRLTRGLERTLHVTFWLFLIGLFETSALWLLLNRESYLARPLPQSTLATAGGLTTLFIAIRPLIPKVQEFIRSHKFDSRHLTLIANVFGLLILFVLVFTYLVALSAFVFGLDPDSFKRPGPSGGGDALKNWSIIFSLAVFYLVISGKNLGQLNLASLHFLYRARLARAYVSVGNTSNNHETGQVPESRFPISPLSNANRERTKEIKRVVDSVPNDDVPLTSYRPHAFGGPIHLINCCINQTVDDRTGNFNADRKGILLTVSSLGAETGTHFPKLSERLKDTTLAQWGVISGAAVASGMGSYTAPGVAALIFLSGFRAGFWSYSLLDTQQISNPTPNVIQHWTAKYRATWAELRAFFPGLNSNQWYLSDGGHFDNTGVYALLKRRLDVIVLADCGADQNYLFGDIENLVRKASIDYSATLEFLGPERFKADSIPLDMLSAIGTPESINSNSGSEYLLVAGVRYSDGHIGTLVIIKPRKTSNLPLDVAAYAARHPKFPNQPTSDQFFDEEQWESYHALGLQLCKVITADSLKSLHAQVRTMLSNQMAQVHSGTAVSLSNRTTSSRLMKLVKRFGRSSNNDGRNSNK